MCYEANAHVPLIIAHPDGRAGSRCDALTSHLDLLPTVIGLTEVRTRPAAINTLPGHDFSALMRDPEKADTEAVRPGVLFSYLSLATVDAGYCTASVSSYLTGAKRPELSQIDVEKRGFLSFVFDGRFKFARFYSPRAFNTPRTLEELIKSNDVQLFDLKTDPDEVRNLALDPEKNRELILRLNGLLNDLITKEVGANDGAFLPEELRAGLLKRSGL